MRLAAVIFILTTLLFSYNFSQEQIENLKECVKISKIFNNPPELVCTIMLNETAAGKSLKKDGIGDKFLKPFRRSYGVMQVRFPTVKNMINKLNIKELKSMPDEKILIHLIEDKRFNIAMANIYITYLRKKYHDNEKKVVIAYNSGYYNPKNIKYYKRFKANKTLFYSFKEKFLN